MAVKTAEPDLKMSPLPHQQRVSSKLTQSPGQLAAHGLGSGKTFTAIQAAHEHGLPLLAIVPASLRENMWKEIRDSGYTGPVDVMSYEKALKLADDPAFQARAKNSLVVYDEAHRMGQYGSLRSELAGKIPAAKTMLLTATPIRNRPAEIAPLINAVQPGTLPQRPSDFDRRYVQQREVPLGFWAKLRGAKRGVVPEPINIDEFRQKTKGLIDFHKALDREHYPTFSESVFEVPMSEEQQAAYDFTMGKYPALAYKIKHGIPPSKSELRNLRSFLIGPRQVSNFPGAFSEKATIADAPKLQAMADQLEKRYREDPNFRGVSYSAFLDAGVHPLSELLAERGIPHTTFTGSVPEKKRQQMVRDYNAGKVPVMLISGAGSEGLDLKGTKLMQIAEPHWHEEQINQVRGRAIRFGSHGHLPEDERHVEVQRFHSQPRKGWFRRLTGMKAPQGVDQYVHGIAKQKQQLNQQFIDALQQDEAKLSSAGHIYLTGPMASGKSTEARRLSKELGFPTLNVDDMVNKGYDWQKEVGELAEPHVIEGHAFLETPPPPGSDLRVVDAPRDELVNRLLKRGWTDEGGAWLQGEKHRARAEQLTDYFQSKARALLQAQAPQQGLKAAGMLTREDIVNQLNEYGSKDMTIGAGSAMVLHGLRPHTSDIDVSVPEKTFKTFHSFYGEPEITHKPPYAPLFQIPGSSIDLHLQQPDEEWGTEELGGVTGRVMTRPELLRFYQGLNRPKDQQWIQALQQGKTAALEHTRDWQGDTYDVNQLIELTEGRPVEQRALGDLRYDRSRKTGFSKARYEGVDLKYPLLVHPSGEVIDGRHRAARWEDAGAQQVPVRVVTDEDLATAKTAAPLGPCLFCSLAAIDADPSLQLMQGPPGREGDTSHFWTVDASGKVKEHTPGAVGPDYAYEGRPVDHRSVREELKISSVVSNWVPFMFANPPTEGVYSAVFFDIDGTLVEDGAFTKPADQQTLLPGRLEVLKELRRHGYVVAAVTNRCDGTAFGKKDISQPECRRRIMGVVHSCKGHLLDVVYEPDPEAYQERRKPNPDLLHEAIAVFDVDPKKAIYVGNSDDDQKAAENAGIPYVDAEEFFADPGKHVDMKKVEHPFTGSGLDLKVVEEAMKTAQQSTRPGDDPIHSGPHSVDFNTAFIEHKEDQNKQRERYKRRLRGVFNEALEQERESRKVV